MDKMEVYHFQGNILKVFSSFILLLVTKMFYNICASCIVVELSFFLFLAEGIADSDLVLLVTTRPTTGNTLAWAVACERDQWGRAIAGNLLEIMYTGAHVCLAEQLINYVLPEGHVNVAPRHLTAEAETLLSATLIHEVS